MKVSIEIKTEGRKLPENPSIDEVLASHIEEQKAILKAFDEKKRAVLEKMILLEGISEEAKSEKG